MLSEAHESFELHRKHNVSVAQAKIDHCRQFKSRVQGLLDELERPPKMALGNDCGKMFPFRYLMSSDGMDVTGLDSQFVSADAGKYFRQLMHDGPRVSLKSLLRDVLFTRKAREILSKENRNPVKTTPIKFVCVSACEMRFSENHFYIVFSYCAFDHIPDIGLAFKECARVLRSDGRAHITYLLYTSISGSHHNRWYHPDTDPTSDPPPWFHLRKEGESEIASMDHGLNRLRLDQYREVFAKHFEVSEEFSDRVERESFLTKEFELELSDFT
jgi:SAM-dependent methyltransferase